MQATANRHSILATVVTVGAVVLASIGALVVGLTLWFFASCANSPTCFRIG